MRRRLLAGVSATLLTMLAVLTGGQVAADVGDTYEGEILVRGAPIHGANGLAVLGKGPLLVASANGGELLVVNRFTGAIVNRLGHEDDVDAPDDVAVGPDGSIYWTDIQVGEVGRRSPGGEVTKQFVGVGVNPIAFSPTGRLFVAKAFMGDALYELDPELVDPPRTVIPDSGAAPFPNQLNGFDFGPDGMLYAPQPFQGKVVRIHPDTGKTITVVSGLPQPPTSVEFDSRGRLFASLRYGTVVRVYPLRRAFEVYVELPDLVSDNMTFDAKDRMYLSDSDNGALYVVASDRSVRLLSRGGLIMPGGVAVMKNSSGRETVFLTDFWSLAEYGTGGRLLDLDRQTRLPGSLIEPQTVAVDGRNLILSSWLSGTVQLWNPTTDTEVALYQGFASPVNAIRFRGDLVVAQVGNPMATPAVPPGVVRQDSTGGRSVMTTAVGLPSGLAATSDDLWVADWVNGKVWQLVADGTVLTTPALTAKGLLHPEGMAVDRDGSLLVVEAGRAQLRRINLLTGGKAIVAAGLGLGLESSAGAPPTSPAMSSVAVASDGTLFVTGDRGSVLYRLTPRD
jgi:sugar lactone lactonase YvrE